MSDLVKLFDAEGCTKVVTFIQSGNVVFDAPQKTAAQLGTRIAKRIDEKLGLTVPVVLRSAEELAQVAGRNPFLRAGADTDALHVLFLRDQPKAAQARALDPARSPGDQYELVGRDVFLR